jgi:Rhs element Vgr protein
MIKSPLSSDSDLPSYKILVDGTAIKDSYQVLSISVEKEINTINTASVVLMDGNPSIEKFEISESEDFVPGKKIDIQLGHHSTNVSVFKGIIVAQQVKVKSRTSGLVSQLTIKCADEALKLTAVKKSANFKDKKDSDIITSLIAAAGLSKTVDATTFQYKKVIQYDVSNWDFILSRAEINGFVVICNDGKLEVGKPNLSGSPVIAVSYGKDVIDFAAELDAQQQIESVTANSWDGTQLKVSSKVSSEPTVNSHGNITGKKLSEVLGAGSFFLKTATPEDPSVLKIWADAKLQKARLAKIRGTVSFSGHSAPALGKLIQLNGFGTRFNGDAYISKVHHLLEGGAWVTHVGFGLNPSWFQEAKPVNTLAAAGLLPGIKGLHIGKVKKIDSDPDGEFRIQVDVPMIEETGEGLWARLAHEYATNEAGTFFLPEVGDEVVLGFINEDPRFAIILGSLFGKKIKPAYTPDAKNPTKAIVTKNKLKLVLDDDKKNINIETPGGNKIVISDENKTITITDQNKNKVEMSSSGIVLDSPKDISITSKGNFTVDAMKIALTSKGDVAIEGLNVNAKAKMAFSAEGSAQASLKASGQVEVKGAIVMIN